MTKYLVELKDPNSDDMALLQLSADSLEEATKLAEDNSMKYEVLRIKHTHGGKRSGSGRTNSWGDGVETKVCRLPVEVANNVKAILGEIEVVSGILECWQNRVDESITKTADGKPAERYKHVAQLLNDLRQAMEVTSKRGDSL